MNDRKSTSKQISTPFFCLFNVNTFMEKYLWHMLYASMWKNGKKSIKTDQNSRAYKLVSR